MRTCNVRHESGLSGAFFTSAAALKVFIVIVFLFLINSRIWAKESRYTAHVSKLNSFKSFSFLINALKFPKV